MWIMSVWKTILFLFVTCLLWSETSGIYGGCMSYSTSHTDVPGRFKVKLYFLNGWKLHQGPCYNCTEKDEGFEVTARRKQYIIDTNNPQAFGIWTFEEEEKGNKQAIFMNLTEKVNNNIKDVVLVVNKHEDWELESSEINLLVDIHSVSNRRFDIMFENTNDGDLTDMDQETKVFLQVKVDPFNRTDTEKPNSSPVVLVKPYYSLEHGTTHSIHIPAVDNDDDLTKCGFSEYIEAGAFIQLVQNLTKTHIIRMNEKECVLTINLNNARFQAGDTFALPVTVKDYGRKHIVTAQDYSAYTNPIGRVTGLMFFKVTGKTDPPKFILPTPPNNQEYTVYVGGDFNVSVYAKPTDSARNIVKFNFLRRDGIRVQQTRIQSVLGDPTAVYISMRWSPVDSDIGKHIVCANAEDSSGISTVEMHCFKITVKANIFRPNPSLPGKPYYASFPEQKDIVCPVRSYCRFPIYAATENSGGIQKIVSTSKSQENVTIQYSNDVLNGTLDTKVAQVEFLAEVPGARQICLNASDGSAWTVRCLIVTVDKRDPCENIPCQNNGKCAAFKDKSGFRCICDERHNGLLCEKVVKMCDQRPCMNTSFCENVMLPPFFYCICPPGKTGARCDVDFDVCNPTPCSENDICRQTGNSYKCLSGNIHRQCHNTCLRSKTTVCVEKQCVCALGIQNDVTCLSSQTNNFDSSNKPYFIPPTPSIGSVITCDFHEKECQFPVYILSVTTPKLYTFNSTNMDKLHGHHVSFLPFESSRDGVYHTTTLVTNTYNSDPKQHEFDVCLIVSEQELSQQKTDRRCFHVIYKGIPSRRLPLSTLYPHCTFAIPTLPRESIIGCKKGQSCHFYLYAEPSAGICSELTTDGNSTGVFSPVLLSGLCRYEVVYTNTSSVGKETVCFMICSKGESRCFQMNTNDLVDDCASNPCLNNGHCHTKPSGNFQCHCPDGFWGKRCENGFCNGHCQNNAVCFTKNGNHDCLCRLGFIGKTCSEESNQNLTDMTENGGQFTLMSLTESLTCYINSPCFVPISITRNVHTMPVIDVGFLDKTLEVQSLDLEPSANIGEIVRGTLIVIGHELGPKLICLDSVANPKTAKIEDEICFRIVVISGHVLEPIETKPYFIKPTLPDGTVLQCVVNQQCYVSLWAKNRVGVEKCPQLEVDKTIEDGVYIFPLQDTTHPSCVYDSVIFIGNVTDLHICFSLPFKASSVYSSERDKRCYTVSVRTKFTAKGSCAGISCYNDGFCDGSSPSSKCLCRSGFSDYNCFNDAGVAQGNNSYSNLQPRFGDLTLPKLIRCPLLENCVIPFSVTQTNNFNSANVRWNGTNINSVNVSLSHMPGSRDLSGSAEVIHTATGNDEFCLALAMGDNVYDRVCCFILTEPAAVHQQFDNGQGLFISPSPTNNSEFSCTPGQSCHVTFKTSKGNDQKCPELRDRSTMPVHIFTALSPNECQRDVLIESQNSTQGTEKYCFQTSSSGILGELRCMTIHFENHGLPPPPPTTTTTTTESPTTVIPSTTTTSSATSNNDHTTTSDNDHTTTSNTVSTSLPGNGPESATNKEISTRQTERLASKEATFILGSVQTITTLGTAQTTQIQSEQTIIALETGRQATTLVTGETTTTLGSDQTTTTLAAEQTTQTTMPAAGETTTTLGGQTTTTLAAGQTTTTLGGQTTTTLAAGQTTTTLAAEQTTQTAMPAAEDTTTTLGGQTTTLAVEQTTQKRMPAAGETTTTLAAGQTTTTLPAAGDTTTTLAAGQTTTLAAEQTTHTEMPAAVETTTTLGGQTTTLAAGQTTTTPAAEQTTQKRMPAAGETTTTLAAGQTTTLAAGQTTTTMPAARDITTTLAAGQTTALAAGQTTTTLAEEQTTLKRMPAAGETTTTLAAGQTTTLAASQTTTTPAAEQTTTTLGGQTATLAAGQTTTTPAAEQTTQKRMPAAGETTTTLAAGQTTTLAAGQTTTTLAAEQTTQKSMPAAGQTTTTLAAGQTTTTLAAGQTTTLAAGQTTTTPAAGDTTTTLAVGQTTTTLAAGQTTTTFATGRTITTKQHKRETCDVVDVQEWAKKGRVKCECFHPTGGTTTTVIAKNPHVSGKSLMVAAGLGSGAMVTMLGTGVLLYAVSQKYFGPRKTGPDSDTNQQKKKLSVASFPDKKQLH